ncbi:MAG: hypothetical protein ABI180_02775 [Microcoleus sp.]
MSQGAISEESPRNLAEQLLLQDALGGNGKGIQGGANNMLGDAPDLLLFMVVLLKIGIK